MTTLIIVICIVAFLIWVGRLLRQRELKKFRDVDVGMLSELRRQHPDVSTRSSQSIDQCNRYGSSETGSLVNLSRQARV